MKKSISQQFHHAVDSVRKSVATSTDSPTIDALLTKLVTGRASVAVLEELTHALIGPGEIHEFAEAVL